MATDTDTDTDWNLRPPTEDDLRPTPEDPAAEEDPPVPTYGEVVELCNALARDLGIVVRGHCGHRDAMFGDLHDELEEDGLLERATAAVVWGATDSFSAHHHGWLPLTFGVLHGDLSTEPGDRDVARRTKQVGILVCQWLSRRGLVVRWSGDVSHCIHLHVMQGEEGGFPDVPSTPPALWGPKPWARA